MHDMVRDVPCLLPSVTVAGSCLPLAARGLVFEAGGKRLIDGVSLTLRAGPVTAVMGPNGAGKSLLLRLLHGLLKPAQGEILWAGRPADRSIVGRQAMVFQRPVLLRRSVAANVSYALETRGVSAPERRRRLEAVLRVARLEHLAERPARVLSGGEQQRLAVARALSLSPEILFLDEPTSSLDPASTLAIEELLRQAQAGGTTLVLVTHDIGQAKRLAQEVVFMNRGRIAEQTTAGRFFVRPESAEAQAFLDGRIVL
jgi:tungstate transport system ATP-binding protein